MRGRTRGRAAGVGALALALASTACWTHPKSTDGSGAIDAACDHYFRAYYERGLACENIELPAERLDALRLRFRQACRSGTPLVALVPAAKDAVNAATDKRLTGVSLPGSSLTPAMLDGCATKLDASACGDDLDDACLTSGPGWLDDDARCRSNSQCASTRCVKDSTAPCGLCHAAIGEDNGCRGEPSACVAGLECIADFSGFERCTRRSTASDVGARCATGTCRTNLHCDPLEHKCAVRGDVGARCLSSDTECRFELTCGFDGRCTERLRDGDSCNDSDASTSAYECMRGSTCDPESGTCVRLHFGAPGEACDGYARQCLVGVCSRSTKVCPAVRADGQPCIAFDTESQCDTFATCTIDPGDPTGAGRCAIPGPSICNVVDRTLP